MNSKRPEGPTPCGFCMTGKHSLCKNTLRNGNKGLWTCSCEETEDCGTRRLRCMECNNLVQDEISPDTHLCIDRDACQASQEKSREDFLQTNIGRTIERSRIMATEQKASTRTPKAPKVGKCIVTGQETKGGLFAPGMDARYVSNLVKAVMAKETTEAKALAQMRKDGVSDKLVAKFEKAIGLAREKANKAPTVTATSSTTPAKGRTASKAKADKVAEAATAEAEVAGTDAEEPEGDEF